MATTSYSFIKQNALQTVCSLLTLFFNWVICLYKTTPFLADHMDTRVFTLQQNLEQGDSSEKRLIRIISNPISFAERFSFKMISAIDFINSYKI